MLVGLYAAIRHRRCQPRYWVILLGLLFSPVPAALTVDRMHGTRCLWEMVFWMLVAAVGARVLWRHKRVGRSLLVVVCAAGLAESAAYLGDYFGAYQMRCQGAFETALTDSLKYCFGRIHSNETLYVSGSVGTICSVALDTDFKPFVYAQLLFFGNICPSSYQHSGFRDTVVRPYLETVDRPGLLLRCNYQPVPDAIQFAAVTNTETIPAKAILLAVFLDEPMEYQVWGVR
jgi:hypothetical protein